MNDLKNNLKLETSLAPILKTTDVNGTGIDLQGFSSAALMALMAASISSSESSLLMYLPTPIPCAPAAVAIVAVSGVMPEAVNK